MTCRSEFVHLRSFQTHSLYVSLYSQCLEVKFVVLLRCDCVRVGTSISVTRHTCSICLTFFLSILYLPRYFAASVCTARWVEYAFEAPVLGVPLMAEDGDESGEPASAHTPSHARKYVSSVQRRRSLTPSSPYRLFRLHFIPT